MKIKLLILLSILSFFSCSKNNEPKTIINENTIFLEDLEMKSALLHYGHIYKESLINKR